MNKHVVKSSLDISEVAEDISDVGLTLSDISFDDFPLDEISELDTKVHDIKNKLAQGVNYKHYVKAIENLDPLAQIKNKNLVKFSPNIPIRLDLTPEEKVFNGIVSLDINENKIIEEEINKRKIEREKISRKNIQTQEWLQEPNLLKYFDPASQIYQRVNVDLSTDLDYWENVTELNDHEWLKEKDRILIETLLKNKI